MVIPFVGSAHKNISPDPVGEGIFLPEPAEGIVDSPEHAGDDASLPEPEEDGVFLPDTAGDLPGLGGDGVCLPE